MGTSSSCSLALVPSCTRLNLCARWSRGSSPKSLVLNLVCTHTTYSVDFSTGYLLICGKLLNICGKLGSFTSLHSIRKRSYLLRVKSHANTYPDRNICWYAVKYGVYLARFTLNLGLSFANSLDILRYCESLRDYAQNLDICCQMYANLPLFNAQICISTVSPAHLLVFT